MKLSDWRSILCVTSMLLSLGFGAEVFGISLQGLGDLEGGDFLSEPQAISDDGTTIVGVSARDGFNEAFRWTFSGGMLGIGLLPGAASSSAFGVSGDGSVVVGVSAGTASTAFRWTQPTGITGLPHLDEGNPVSIATDVSFDGTMIVGSSSGEGFRYIEPDGLTGYGDLPGGFAFSQFNAVSADGAVAAGSSAVAAGAEAVRHDDVGGLVGMGYLPGGDGQSNAFDLSDDGRVIVGFSQSTNGIEAFRWTAEDDEMVGLGDLAGGNFNSTAKGVSADGSIVVGLGMTLAGEQAFYWTQEHGMRPMSEVLIQDYNIDLGGWQLLSAEAISADGTVITGRGINPAGEAEGWVAVVPEPSSAGLMLVVVSCAYCRRRVT